MGKGQIEEGEPGGARQPNAKAGTGPHYSGDWFDKFKFKSVGGGLPGNPVCVMQISVV